MERCSPEFKGRYSEPEHLDDIERARDDLVRLKRPRIDVPTLVPEFYEKGRMPRLPVKIMVLMQVAIRRGLELSESMIRDANAFSYTPVWTSSRSIFELASLIFDAKEKVRGLLVKWDEKAYLDLDEHLDNVLLGFKSKAWTPKAPPDVELTASNIITIIQRIEKNAIPEFFKLYELLSEVAHPNYMGMLEQYQRLTDDEPRVTILIDSPARVNTEAISIPLDNAAGTLTMLAQAITDFEGWFKGFCRLAAENILDENEGAPARNP
jgi:hypothetical protein